MSTPAPWSTPGRRSAPARRSARTATSRAAPASAACSSRCRPGPVIIEDNCFIGARAEVAEGVIVREGSVLSMGVYLGASTKIVDRETGAGAAGRGAALLRRRARAPCRASRCRTAQPGPSLYCAVIVKRVDEKTRVQDQHQRTAARLASSELTHRFARSSGSDNIARWAKRLGTAHGLHQSAFQRRWHESTAASGGSRCVFWTAILARG